MQCYTYVGSPVQLVRVHAWEQTWIRSRGENVNKVTTATLSVDTEHANVIRQPDEKLWHANSNAITPSPVSACTVSSVIPSEFS